MPPRAKRKYEPDVGWSDKLGGYVVRVLLQRNIEGTGYEALSKDLEGVVAGIGSTERDAMNMVKDHLQAKLTKIRDEHGDKIPYTEISCVRTFGAKIKWCLIRVEPAKEIGTVPPQNPENK